MEILRVIVSVFMQNKHKSRGIIQNCALFITFEYDINKYDEKKFFFHVFNLILIMLTFLVIFNFPS